MKSAKRVFCDFTTGGGNFYAYYGNFKDKVIIIIIKFILLEKINRRK